MRIQTELILTPNEAWDDSAIEHVIRKSHKLKPTDTLHIVKLRRSIDARGRQAKIILLADIYVNELPETEPQIKSGYKNVSKAQEVIIIGAGPAGYFAALELIERGMKPVIFDRGKDARTRRKDLRAIQQFGEVNPDSNYCFGEGGAGTYSDGKLYTRSNKRGDVRKALKILVEHGADADILVDAHPHIGSNKLPKIVQAIRETILSHGGEVHFDSKVTDIIIENGRAKGVIVNDKDEHIAEAVILATGHSARDIFYMLRDKGIKIEFKPFAMGVRVEHPQSMIDNVQYKCTVRPDNLPAASYKLVTQSKGRGVFSFCMCPGGLIVPASTAPGELVVNGMSMSRRDSHWANSGVVVQIEKEDLHDYAKHGELAGLEFQKEYEARMFSFIPDGTQKAPAQRVTDFVKGRLSTGFDKPSYIPGIFPADMNEILPKHVSERLKEALVVFGKKIRGYYSDEGVMIGLESRTSSPVRIPRDRETLEHPEVKGLYPCGEGAGYAGGIISAAIDGQNVAGAVFIQ